MVWNTEKMDWMSHAERRRQFGSIDDEPIITVHYTKENTMNQPEKDYIHKYPNVKGYDELDGDVKAVQQALCFSVHQASNHWLPVSSAKDGEHTLGSVHPDGLAVDLGLGNLIDRHILFRIYEDTGVVDSGTASPLHYFYHILMKNVEHIAAERGVFILVKWDERHIHIQKGERNLLGGASRYNHCHVICNDATYKLLKEGE
jgi:hypothetical protein